MSEPETAISSSSGDRDPTIILGVLSAIESDARVTQRKISSDLGIALGLANAYLKRCVRKGWIKVRQVPVHRYAYYLTPQGFSEKTRLTAEYLVWSFEFFRRARRNATELFADARARGLTQFVLVGAGDLAEVVTLSAIDADVAVLGILDATASAKHCAGKPIFQSVAALLAHARTHNASIDALIVTAYQAPQDALAVAQAAAIEIGLPATPEHILLPSVLKIRWTNAPQQRARQ